MQAGQGDRIPPEGAPRAGAAAGTGAAAGGGRTTVWPGALAARAAAAAPAAALAGCCVAALGLGAGATPDGPALWAERETKDWLRVSFEQN